MLKNEPSLAIGGVDTAENEPFKVGGFLTGVGGVMSSVVSDLDAFLRTFKQSGQLH